ncbi:response regulator [Nocardia sp. NPDC101769]|uniref:response regulator n=1 Tax=Nocardia sp. NPDC101769 TaxID=3364333 RepID=UPI003810E7EE
MIRVLLVDDHPIVREGLRGILCGETDISVVGEAATADEAVAAARMYAPDVIFMDLRMPGDGVTAIERIVAARADVRIVVVTTYNTDTDILRAVAAGAVGFLLKDSSRAVLIDAVRAAHRGETVLGRKVADRLIRGIHRSSAGTLSVREIEVLTHASKGLTNAQIGRALHIGESTVKTHLLRAYGKLNVSDRAAAVTAAISLGILMLDN